MVDAENAAEYFKLTDIDKKGQPNDDDGEMPPHDTFQNKDNAAKGQNKDNAAKGGGARGYGGRVRGRGF